MQQFPSRGTPGRVLRTEILNQGPDRRTADPGRISSTSDRTPVVVSISMESRRIFTLLLFLFAGSGCAALIYEIVWFQLLQLVIGSSAISLGFLLAAYMGGLCLGSAFLPRIVSPRQHPLRVYAVLELGIGILGLVVLFVIPLVGRIYVAAATQGFIGLVLRGAIAALFLLPPTLLMGASLPAIVRKRAA